ncbi:N-formylglutamate amidohydrolase [Sphingomicrobium lutaoense]|uniref:N-formylglutamate amidohydrolase n=1 Tax=Sphingomicrobium lutaoense TaxID=515949 RepID=A0A839YYE1_9SPHN|nr:N-formylglutamate amidohydrolase [Sphingomicrobium lutaoense]MBB3763338.1 N-formylglutamate amidohydrolase [Sphingomicrobium lutaoense]
MREPPLLPPAIHPPADALPLILSVPHSGREIDRAFERTANGGRKAIMALADPLVDRLVDGLVVQGHGAVIARNPRGIIDCNRAPDDLDPAVVARAPPPPSGARAAHGLGLIPARTSRPGLLWPPLDEKSLAQRIRTGWAPYHDALAAMIDRVAARHGGVVLLDCHSMPRQRGMDAQLVIGDRHGSSAAPWLSALAGEQARSMKMPVAFNHPFAGGHIARAHGNPAANIHVLQLEFCRSAYLDPLMRGPGPGFARTRTLIERIAGAIVAAWPRHGLAAAE